ncbi:hypothetical protein WR25_00293 isoform C [Diploscapter pachys]|uniref:RDD domain-containing protein n=1 Tax=Diploscapter pachys TaxID=2018661 RepID=A0A2A2LMT9_9BILA|nr:hypothetical protein WR25_00293 isoform C [Diploscapter pachys]
MEPSTDSRTPTGSADDTGPRRRVQRVVSPFEIFASLDNEQRHDYGSFDAYCDQIRHWIYHTQQVWNCHNYMINNNFSQNMVTMNSFNSVSNTHLPNARYNVSVTFTQGMNNIANPRVIVTSNYRIASYVRRFLAECIDFLFSFFIKILIMYFLVEFEFIDIGRYEKLLGDEADIQSLIDVTQDLFPIEMLGKMISSILEALCLSYGMAGNQIGSTPGKAIFGIRVISCHSLSSVPGSDLVRVVGDVRVPFWK